MAVVDQTWLNSINRAKRIDPAKALVRLRAIECGLLDVDIPSNVRALRTNALRHDREIRDACLFSYGMSCRIGQTVWVYPREESDFDFVAAWEVPPTRHFAMVQLKEVVPHKLNPLATLQAVIDRLSKYPVSRDLTVAIKVNREGPFDPTTITVPQLNIASLWVFGSASADQSKWFLCGNFLETPEISLFSYPS
ncbi:MAG: hypothetical protein AB7M05_15355 [Alphaproteobacteria bacterium]